MARSPLMLAGGALVAAGAAGLAWLAFRRPEEEVPVELPAGICKTAAPSAQPSPPPGWRQYSDSVSSVATSAAVHALSLPLGTWTTFTDEDGGLLGILRMWHCHEPDSGMHPVGWHQGSTLYRPA